MFGEYSRPLNELPKMYGVVNFCSYLYGVNDCWNKPKSVYRDREAERRKREVTSKVIC